MKTRKQTYNEMKEDLEDAKSNFYILMCITIVVSVALIITFFTMIPHKVSSNELVKYTKCSGLKTTQELGSCLKENNKLIESQTSTKFGDDYLVSIRTDDGIVCSMVTGGKGVSQCSYLE